LKLGSNKSSHNKSLARNVLDSILAMTVGFILIIPTAWFCIFVLTSESAYQSFSSVLEYLDFIAIMFFAVGLPFDLFDRIRIKHGDKSI
jgi:hypothetical protein